MSAMGASGLVLLTMILSGPERILSTYGQDATAISARDFEASVADAGRKFLRIAAMMASWRLRNAYRPTTKLMVSKRVRLAPP